MRSKFLRGGAGVHLRFLSLRHQVDTQVEMISRHTNWNHSLEFGGEGNLYVVCWRYRFASCQHLCAGCGAPESKDGSRSHVSPRVPTARG